MGESVEQAARRCMKWRRGTSAVVGSYTLRECVAGGWYVCLTATGETLRGPLRTFYEARNAAQRYDRMTCNLRSCGL